ncbi:MAG TPA: leucyl aminopeptidase [Chloroflexota bacterium]
MKIALAGGPVADLEVDVVVLFEPELDRLSPPAATLDERTGGRVERARRFKELTGKLYETGWVHTEGGIAASRVLTVGIGKPDELTPERMRRAASVAARQLRRREVRRAALGLDDALGDDLVQALADGLVVGDFETGLYKSSERAKAELEEVLIGTPGAEPPAGWAEPLRRGRILGEAANMARSLALQPGNRLTPSGLAEEARRLAESHGLEVEVVGPEQLEALGAGALLGVAQGSLEPPCLIVLRYRSARPGGPTPRQAQGRLLALVGKGVTFDSGGISIKPAQGMQEMKYDMCGAAATIGAMRAIAELKPSIDVLGVVPATENLLGNRAMKPGDVLTAMNGKTIEVVNTDAEGRLILADALVYAQRQGATHLIDAATLTGGCITALGHHASGLFGRPDEWVEKVRGASERAGDRVWPLPLFPEYREQLKSDVADIVNSGGRNASPCTAAMFLKEFVEDGASWAHLDIAGTAYTTAERSWQPAGPTAAGLRLFVEVALAMAAEKPGAPVDNKA